MRGSALVVGDDDHLGRPARQVDRHVARDLELRVVHVLVAGADDLVDAADVREPADRLRPAERPDLVDPEQLGRGGDEAGALRRRADDDPLDARGLRGDGAHDERRDEVARHVDADRLRAGPSCARARRRARPRARRRAAAAPRASGARGRRARASPRAGAAGSASARAGSAPSSSSAQRRTAASPSALISETMLTRAPVDGLWTNRCELAQFRHRHVTISR